MKKVPAKYLAWFLWTVSMGLWAFIILVVHFLVPSIGQELLAVDIMFVLAFTAMATTGTIVVSRLPGNPIGWLLLVIPLVAITAETASIYAEYAVHVRPEALPGGAVTALVSNALWIVFLASMAFLVLLFPGGTLLSARWSWVSWGLVGAFVVLIASSSLRPELDILEVQPPLRSPIAIAGAEGILTAIMVTASVAIILLWIAATVSLVLRFIRSTGDERQQIKWFAYAVGVFVIIFLVGIFLEVTGTPLPNIWDAVLFVGSFSLLPAGIAVAMLKYRLYDIDLLINRTLVYGALTAMLVGTYFGSVVLLQTAFRAVTDQGGSVAFVISTLAIAALFMPLRGAIQSAIDRRFFRRKYDAALTLAAFSAKMRDEVDLERLGDQLVTVVKETMQPAHVSLWLHNQGGRQ